MSTITPQNTVKALSLATTLRRLTVASLSLLFVASCDHSIGEDNNAKPIPDAEPPIVESSKTLTGFNSKWRYMPAPEASNYAQFVNNVKSLKPQLIRYPGGTITHKWDWQNGQVSPVRPGDIQHPIAHLTKLAQTADVDVVFVLDIINRTVDDQIEMLKASNLPVKYIELGNEIYSGEYKDQLPSGKEYAERANEWVPKIRQQFPEALLSATLLGRAPTETNDRLVNWNQLVTEHITDIDAFTYHIYVKNDITVAQRISEYQAQFIADTGKQTWITEYGIQQEDELSQQGKAKHLKQLFDLVFFVENNSDIALNHILLTKDSTFKSENFSAISYDGSALTPVGEALTQYRKVLSKPSNGDANLVDSDEDGVVNNADAFPADATESADNDEDGIGDNSDAFPTDSSEWLDSDGDEVGDNGDAFPYDPTEWLDSDGDGVGDNSDPTPNAEPPYNLANESYTVETIYSYNVIKGNNDSIGNAGAEILKQNEIFSQYGDSYYILAMNDGRPELVKINKANTSLIEKSFIEADDYRPRDDNHHDFVMAIDSDGYIHIVGDMHNYPKNSFNHMPTRLQGQNVMYWRSTAPGDITSMSFLGGSATQSPQGMNFTYPHFFQDNNGALYLSSRNDVGGQNAAWENAKGGSLTKYDDATGTWSLIGEYSDNAEAEGKLSIQEDDRDISSSYYGYSKIHPSIAFDKNNRMHYTATTLNDNTINYVDVAAANGSPDTIYHWQTDSIYLLSDNGGQDFYKADASTAVQLPARVEAGNKQAELVYHSPGVDTILGVDTFITTDWQNNPIVAIDKDRLTNIAVPGLTLLQYNGSGWTEYENLGNSSTYDATLRNIMSDSDGVITTINQGKKYLWRFWSPEDTPVRVDVPVVLDGADRMTLKATGDILGHGYDRATNTFSFIKIGVTKPAQ